MSRIVVIGATSAMVAAALRHFAAAGDVLFLAGKDPSKVVSVAQDLKTRGAAHVETFIGDLAAEGSSKALFDAAQRTLENIDCVILGYGTLADQKRAEKDLAYAASEIRINYTSAVEHCLVWAEYFEHKRSGHIAVITSVAGDRGRQSNYIYGSAKGALTLFLGGLRNRLSKVGVTVTTIKPGFVDSPMTAEVKKGPLFVSASTAGVGIYNAVVGRKDVVYLPWFWQIIMTIICCIPERIFKRLSL